MDTKGKIMITCEEATYLISKKQQDKLSHAERLKLFMHLIMCRYCYRFASQVTLITKAIKRLKRRIENKQIKIKLTEEQQLRLNSAIKKHRCD
ncbi:hypothetical protein DMA11_07110 [Marinilabiliaceae bacterium JC017]|nr:hypothetical protein DMA11_07110 [Marinilabiliaceae bacterium JC017]